MLIIESLMNLFNATVAIQSSNEKNIAIYYYPSDRFCPTSHFFEIVNHFLELFCVLYSEIEF
jgi:hypothetical protein